MKPTTKRIRKAVVGFFSFKSTSVFLIFIGLMMVFGTLSPSFLTERNLRVMFRIAPELLLVTTGMGILLISGEFDLSVGSELALCAFIAAWTFTELGWNPYLSLIVTLAFGATLGVINGLLVTKLRISSLIVTLGTMWIFRGIVYVSSEGFPVYYRPDTASPTFLKMFTGSIGPIPVQILWVMGVVVFLYIMLEHTRFGNWIFATGSKKEAARMMGINTDLVKIICFAIVGFLAALAGVMQSCRIMGAYSVQGKLLNLRAIAASVVGGCSIYGGVGSVPGAAFGGMIVYTLSSGLSNLGVSAFYFYIALGLMLIGAVAFNIWLKEKRAR